MQKETQCLDFIISEEGVIKLISLLHIADCGLSVQAWLGSPAAHNQGKFKSANNSL